MLFACAKQDTPEHQDKEREASAVAIVIGDAAPAAAPTDAASSANKITISVEPPKAPGSGFAKRCALGGAPLVGDCVGGSAGLAIGDADDDKAGTLFVTNAGELHRFTIEPDCKLVPKDAPLALPPNKPRPQVVGKGPMYMRSGGVAWELVQTPDAIYALDYLVGLFRVDRGKPEPMCTAEFGFRGFAKVGKRLLGARKGIEEVVLGKAGACTAKSAGIDDKARDLFAARDKVYTKLDDLGVRICHASAITACGDSGACILDSNCPGITQLDGDGKVVRQIEGSKLFDKRPWSFGGIATARDGTVYLYARHKDKIDGKDVCEAAVYMIPPAVFAL